MKPKVKELDCHWCHGTGKRINLSSTPADHLEKSLKEETHKIPDSETNMGIEVPRIVLLEEIDDILSGLEDTIKGESGDQITVARGKFSQLFKTVAEDDDVQPCGSLLTLAWLHGAKARKHQCKELKETVNRLEERVKLLEGGPIVDGGTGSSKGYF